MRKNEKIIFVSLPQAVAKKLDEMPYFPEGIITTPRIRGSNCRFLLMRGIDRHINRENFMLKEPVNCSYQVGAGDTKIGFIVPEELDRVLEELMKHYLLTKKSLASLLICQEAKRQEERREGGV